MTIRTRYRRTMRGAETVTATVTVNGKRHTERGPAGGYFAHERVARTLAARLGHGIVERGETIVQHGYRFHTHPTSPETQP